MTLPEAARERDGRLAVAGRDVEREPVPGRAGGEPVEECRGVLGPEPPVGFRLQGEVVLESGRRGHRAIVAAQKNAPDFWSGAEVRTFGEGKEVR